MVTLVSPPQLIAQWEGLGVSDEVIAGALRANLRSVRRWRNGSSYPQNETRARLAALDSLYRRLIDSFAEADDLRVWLHADCQYLAGLKPVDALHAGRLERVEAAVEALDSGFFV